MTSSNYAGKLLTVAALFSSVILGAEPQSLRPELEPYLKQFGLPAIAAAVFKNGVIVASASVGTRRAGSDSRVKPNDAFHLGSDSKAFTALIAAQFIEEGKLRWNSTLAEAFPELKNTMDPGFATVTIEQLLSHASGLSDGTLLEKVIEGSYLQTGNMDEVRYWIVKQTAPLTLDHAPGSKFDYSNLGYMMAGSILERIGKKTWEELVEERILRPMNLKTAGFGPQASLGKVDAPLGHVLVNGQPKGMLAGPNGDNPLILGPAGTLHMSVQDFARWVAWNSAEGKLPPALVSSTTLKKLHTPVIATGDRPNPPPGTPLAGGYALGWGQVTFDWADSPAITHTGSNNMNLAVATFWPKTDFGFVMMTNISGAGADEALRKLAAQLYQTFSSKPN